MMSRSPLATPWYWTPILACTNLTGWFNSVSSTYLARLAVARTSAQLVIAIFTGSAEKAGVAPTPKATTVDAANVVSIVLKFFCLIRFPLAIAVIVFMENFLVFHCDQGLKALSAPVWRIRGFTLPGPRAIDATGSPS